MASTSPIVRNNLEWVRAISSSWVPPGLTVVANPAKRFITVGELKAHNKYDDIWIAIRGKVYDVTAYLAVHPGGEAQLMRVAGGDGTALFDAIHKWVSPESTLGPCWMGMLGEPSKDATDSIVELTPQLVKLASAAEYADNRITVCNLSVPILSLIMKSKSGQAVTLEGDIGSGRWAGGAYLLTDKKPATAEDLSHGHACYCLPNTSTSINETSVFLVKPFTDEVYTSGATLYLAGPMAPINVSKLLQGGLPPNADFRHILARGLTLPDSWASYSEAERFVATRGMATISDAKRCICWSGGKVESPEVTIVVHGMDGLACVLPLLWCQPVDDVTGIAEDAAPAWTNRITVVVSTSSTPIDTIFSELLHSALIALEAYDTHHLIVVGTPELCELEKGIAYLQKLPADSSAVATVSRCGLLAAPTAKSVAVLVGQREDVFACDDSLRAAYYPAAQLVYIPLA